MTSHLASAKPVPEGGRLKSALSQPKSGHLGSGVMETFMVRVWRPAGEERSDGVRGTAVHLGSGRHIAFSEPGGLIEFLSKAADTDITPAAEAGSNTSAQME
jgi:hypothetical protein